MDAIREQLNRPVIAGVAGLILGLIIGWFIIGWGIWPVQWTDARPQDLVYSEKVEYLRMAMQAYGHNLDSNQALQRYNALGDERQAVLDEISRSPGTVSPAVVLSFRALVLAESTPAAGVLPTVPPGTPAADATPGAAPVEAPRVRSLLTTVLTILFVMALLVAAGVIVFFVAGSRGGVKGLTKSFRQPVSPPAQPVSTGYESAEGEPPLVHFFVNYKRGDDLFDESQSVDTQSGEFLGECGVSIAESKGVSGDKKWVTAFEVWLFDKAAINTATKVIMSQHAYFDEDTRQELEPKGELVLAEPNQEIELATTNLRMVVRIADMAYGSGPLPPESFFEYTIFEFAVWTRNNTAY